MVINISMLKSGNASFVADEISGIVEAVPGSVVKVIIEACYLTDEEKLAALEAAITSGAHFVKTSTGFGPKGAEVRDVELLAAAAAGRIKVKASGGIKTLEAALSMIKAGATRLGTSSGPSILEEMRGRQLNSTDALTECLTLPKSAIDCSKSSRCEESRSES